MVLHMFSNASRHTDLLKSFNLFCSACFQSQVWIWTRIQRGFLSFQVLHQETQLGLWKDKNPRTGRTGCLPGGNQAPMVGWAPDVAPVLLHV